MSAESLWSMLSRLLAVPLNLMFLLLTICCYSDGANPYALVHLGSSLVSQQAYSVHLSLSLPRSPPNLAVGTFMVDISLLSPLYIAETYDTVAPLSRTSIPSEAILYHSRRPSMLTYYSPLIDLSKEIATLPWYLLGLRRNEEKLAITLAESVAFPKGWRNVPKTVYIELQGSRPDIQVYSAQLALRAKFSGLRWIMYNYRILSFVAFSGAFWGAEVLFTLMAWLLWNVQSSGKVQGKGAVKSEDEASGGNAIKKDDEGADTDDLDLSDTPRSFPTYGRQAPLRYTPKVKVEPDDDEDAVLDETTIQPLAAEAADDESEEPMDINFSFSGGGRSDSGLGTSFSEAAEGARSVVSRRKSRGGKGPG